MRYTWEFLLQSKLQTCHFLCYFNLMFKPNTVTKSCLSVQIMVPNFAKPFFPIFSLLLGLSMNRLVFPLLNKMEQNVNNIIYLILHGPIISNLDYLNNNGVIAALLPISSTTSLYPSSTILFELLHSSKPKYNHIHAFGYLGFASTGHPNSDKFHLHAHWYVVIGFPTD